MCGFYRGRKVTLKVNERKVLAEITCFFPPQISLSLFCFSMSDFLPPLKYFPQLPSQNEGRKED